MFYPCVFLSLATLASASYLQDDISLLQRSVEMYKPLRREEEDPSVPAFHSLSTTALAGECLSLGQRVNASSGEEAMPVIKALTDSARALLSLDQPLQAFSCLAPITRASLFNHRFALMVNRTQGGTPLETIIETVRRYPDNAHVQQNYLPGITNVADPLGGEEMVEEVERLGGLKAILDGMHRFTGEEYGDVLMMAWAAYSDFAFSHLGSAALANHGGHLQGCKFAVSQMRDHPWPYFAKTSLNLTLKYEILMTVNGMLTRDSSGDYSRSCFEGGILEQILHTMRVEDDLRASEDIGCLVMNRLLQHNASLATTFRNAGAVEAAKHALDKFGGEDNTEFLVGVSVGSWYNVAKDCQQTLSSLQAA